MILAKTVLTVVAYQGKLEGIKYMVEVCHANSKNISNNAILRVAEKCDLKFIKYLNEVCHIKKGRSSLTIATELNNLDIIKYFIESC